MREGMVLLALTMVGNFPRYVRQVEAILEFTQILVKGRFL